MAKDEISLTDLMLWTQATKEVVRLDNQHIAKEGTHKPKMVTVSQKTEIYRAAPKGKPQELVIANTAGIDRNSVKKMDRGEYPIEANLDLHGYTVKDAFARLKDFVNISYSANMRMILVITGKATNNKESLKNMLPAWLQNEAIKDKIIRFNYAAQKHGGTGAFYILLKRQ
jgi:DNA-nicking Smr family endonuclease